MQLKPMEGGLWIKQSDTVNRESERDKESTDLGIRVSLDSSAILVSLLPL